MIPLKSCMAHLTLSSLVPQAKGKPGFDEEDSVDFSTKKKKKKPKEMKDDTKEAEEEAEDDGDDEIPPPPVTGNDDEEDDDDDDDDGDNANDGDDVVDENGFVSIPADREYKYEELLDRMYSLLHANNPELAGDRKRFLIKPPQARM